MPTEPQTTIWLVIEFEANSGQRNAVSAYLKEENARAHAATLVGIPGTYISLQSLEIQDAA